MKNSEIIRTNMMENIKSFLEEKGEEVLTVKSNTYCVPWVLGDDEGYINITFAIPKGSRDGTIYDGYEEAENYKIETAQKEEKKKENAAKKAAKIERDKKMREEAKKKREEAKNKKDKEGE